VPSAITCSALAALIVADNQGVPFEDAARAIATFDGTGRRFDLRGDIEGVAVIDDYAHHPRNSHHAGRRA
jgi:UDP-N-acetylmuramate--alanine ligase